MGWNPFKAVKNFVNDVVDFVVDVVETVVDVVVDVVDIVLSPFGLNMDQPDLQQDQQARIQGVLVNKDGAVNHIPIVYGTRRVGGSRVFVSTNGTDNKYLYVALVLSEGQVDSYTKLYIDNNEVTMSSYAHGVQATPTTGRYKDRLVAQFFDGRDNQTVSTLLQEAPGWTSTHRLRGISYLALRYEWKKIETQEDADNNPYGGIPQANVLLRGRKILDATTVSGAYDTAYASDTKIFDNNPVSVLLDYMRNPRYGKGLGNAFFDFASFKTAADQCDQTVDYTDTTTGKAFTCDAVVETSTQLMDNVKLMLSGFRGIMPYQQGKYFLKIENGGDDTDVTATPSSPDITYTVTTDEIIGGVSLSGENKQDKINRAVVTYTDPDADYQANDVVYPEEGTADDTAYLAEDEVRLEKRFTFNMITSREQALQMAEVLVKKSRTNRKISFAGTSALSNISVGDIIRVINANIALDGYFRVQAVTLTSQGDVQIAGTQHNPEDYVINAKSTPRARPVINLPDPNQVTAPTGLTVASGSQYNLLSSNNETIRRLYVNWTASTDPFLTNYIVQFRKSSDADYITVAQTTETYFYISPVALGETYDVRVASRNELNRRSNYVTSTNNKVTETYVPASGVSSDVETTGTVVNVSQEWQ